MGVNVSYVGQPKFVSPFGDKKIYLVPAVKDQQGVENNYIIVCCSPTYNGVGRCPAENYKKYDKWKNGKLPCYYVPLDDCELVKKLEDIDIIQVLEKIERTQAAGLKRAQPKKLPSGLIIKQLAE